MGLTSGDAPTAWEQWRQCWPEERGEEGGEVVVMLMLMVMKMILMMTVKLKREVVEMGNFVEDLIGGVGGGFGGEI